MQHTGCGLVFWEVQALWNQYKYMNLFAKTITVLLAFSSCKKGYTGGGGGGYMGVGDWYKHFLGH